MGLGHAWSGTQRFPLGKAGLLSAYQTFLELEKYLADCVVLGGYGYPLQPGTKCDLHFAKDEVSIHAGRSRLSIPYEEVQGLGFGGPGAITSGGGFIGGGFFGDGLSAKGPIEGMVVASVLNRLTTRTRINTIVRLQTRNGELFFHYSHATPEDLPIKLSRVLGRLQEPKELRPRRTSSPDLAERLVKLGDLLEKGLLTLEEFQAAKAKLLRQSD